MHLDLNPDSATYCPFCLSSLTAGLSPVLLSEKQAVFTLDSRRSRTLKKKKKADDMYSFIILTEINSLLFYLNKKFLEHRACSFLHK